MRSEGRNVVARWRRFRALPATRRALLRECGLALLLATWRVRTWRFSRLAAWMGEAAIPKRRTDEACLNVASAQDCAVAQEVRWALKLWTRVWPLGPLTCLMQAVAARQLLVRRRLACELYFGVRGRAAGASPLGHDIGAHAWLCCAGVAVTGEEEAAAFQPIAVYRWRAEDTGGAK